MFLEGADGGHLVIPVVVHGRVGGDLALPFHRMIFDGDDRGGLVFELEDDEHGDDLAGPDGLDTVGIVGAREGEFGAGRRRNEDREGEEGEWKNFRFHSEARFPS